MLMLLGVWHPLPSFYMLQLEDLSEPADKCFVYFASFRPDNCNNKNDLCCF